MSGTSIQLGCAHLGTVRHVCAFFNDDEEAYRVLLPFITDGFDCGDKAIHIMSQAREAAHLERLAETGIEIQAAQASGQLYLRRNSDTYLSDGQFDPDRMLAWFEAMATDTHGYRRCRIVCDMDWATERPLTLDDVIGFEARVNDLWSQREDVVICIYDVKKLSGDMVIDIMRTHPMVLIGEVLQQNPFFVPPGQFLDERLGRRSNAATPQ